MKKESPNHTSNNNFESPKESFASLLALAIDEDISSIFQTILIPLPPPPADAFNKTGKPISVNIRHYSIFCALSNMLLIVSY